MTTINKRTLKTLLSQKLSDPQFEAAAERDRNVVVTAGAGSGKTRTLVARYLSLLADGIPPNKVVAITFTEKAANEMRARVRSAIRDQVVQANHQEDQRFWSSLEQRIDAARIGTIHSLCAEILRTYPAQAKIDPLFDVVDEGEATILLVEAVENTLVKITQDVNFQALFELLKVKSMEDMLTQMMQKRLVLDTWLHSQVSFDQFVKEILTPFMNDEEMLSCVQELQSFSPQALESDTTPKGVEQVQDFLNGWQKVETFWVNGDLLRCLQSLTQIRSQVLNKRGGKEQSVSKVNLSTIKGLYDQFFSWIEKDFNPDLEEKIARAIPLLKEAFAFTLELYNQALSNLRALDFDDLEIRALKLLQQPEIAQTWQKKVDALLVDEFQDTNQRQRQLIEALTAETPGALFVVGDARQSIYRFRLADVTIFREVQAMTRQSGGLVCDLVESHRTHPGLMNAMDVILAGIMGTEEEHDRPYQVPFTKMIPARENFPMGVRKPYLEVLIGAGSDAEEGRLLAANLLAEQLVAFKQAGEILDWKDVALLFRASGAFPIYEQALEAAGIPYVTVAGSGFYDRPEIRDLLNLLRTIADPWDDLAMVGFLRSPAIGMSDRGITQLRWSRSENEPVPFRYALGRDLSFLSEKDLRAANAAARLLAEMEPLVGYVPVAALLQKLLEKTHYRVVLAGTFERGWRNVEKLLMDAYSSQQMSVHAYLEYVQRIRDTGVREGEAAGAAEDALQIMTIHRAKGLEFPWVILADAGRQTNVNKDRWLVDDAWLTFNSDRENYVSLLTSYLKENEKEKEAAETKRILYVALTRARDKLIISGHFSQFKERFTVNGWLKEILNIFDLDANLVMENRSEEVVQFPIAIRVRTDGVEIPFFAPEGTEEYIVERTLTEEIPYPENEIVGEDLIEMNADIFETSHKSPFWVGKLLHRAIHRWEFRSSEVLQQFFERSALELGIFELDHRKRATHQAKLLMERLMNHPIYDEINKATRRYHEIPYEISREINNERGRLDILYQTPHGWKIVDFKTDQLKSLSMLDEDRRIKYQAQLHAYQHAIFQQTKEKPIAQLCFLNCGNDIVVVDIEKLY